MYVCECDTSGNVVYDGAWQTTYSVWTIGNSNNGESYGSNGYPTGVSHFNRREDVTYANLIFRWNNSDPSMGAGTSYPINANILKQAFPIFYIVTKTFTYI